MKLKYIVFLFLIMLVPFASLAKVVPSQLPSLKSKVTVSATTTAEWKFNYSETKLRLGMGKDDVKYKESDIVNLFWVMNNRLYEDGKWSKNTKKDDFKIWNIFAKIAGEEFVDEHITRYATYKDADTGILGFVELLSHKDPVWGLAINANASNFESEKYVKDVVSVLIHEYAHVLTLNSNELYTKKTKATSCKGEYLSLKGCMKKKSYLSPFVKQFWSKEDLAYTGKPSAYYKKHKDDFVTDYAPKNPEEDIAESFTQFILYTKPDSTSVKEKDLKVLFFYKYPELVEMRTRIRGEIKEYFE